MAEENKNEEDVLLAMNQYLIDGRNYDIDNYYAKN